MHYFVHHNLVQHVNLAQEVLLSSSKNVQVVPTCAPRNVLILGAREYGSVMSGTSSSASCSVGTHNITDNLGVHTVCEELSCCKHY